MAQTLETKILLSAADKTAPAFAAAAANARSFANQMNAFGRQVRNIGLGLTAAVTTPLVAFAKSSLSNWEAQEKALLSVEQALKSTGNAAGWTQGQLEAMANELQMKAVVADEKVLQDVTATLLRFTNIRGEAFKQAQQLAVDLAAATGKDLRGAAETLGKALNNPVKATRLLAEVGIVLDEQQQKQIATMVKAGRIAEVQAVIIEAAQRRVGGQAEAQSRTLTKQLELAGLVWGDFQEGIGKVVAEGLAPLVQHLKSAAVWFRDLSPEVQRNIVMWGALAAAAGPAMIVLGSAAMGLSTLLGAARAAAWALGPLAKAVGLVLPGLSGVSTAAAALAGISFAPLALGAAALAAAGLLIWKYWEPLTEFARGFAKALRERLAPAFKVLAPIVERIGDAFRFLDKWGGRTLRFAADLATPTRHTAEELERANKAGKSWGKWVADVAAKGFDFGARAARATGLADAVAAQRLLIEKEAGLLQQGLLGFVRALGPEGQIGKPMIGLWQALGEAAETQFGIVRREAEALRAKLELFGGFEWKLPELSIPGLEEAVESLGQIGEWKWKPWVVPDFNVPGLGTALDGLKKLTDWTVRGWPVAPLEVPRLKEAVENLRRIGTWRKLAWGLPDFNVPGLGQVLAGLKHVAGWAIDAWHLGEFRIPGLDQAKETLRWLTDWRLPDWHLPTFEIPGLQTAREWLQWIGEWRMPEFKWPSVGELFGAAREAGRFEASGLAAAGARAAETVRQLPRAALEVPEPILLPQPPRDWFSAVLEDIGLIDREITATVEEPVPVDVKVGRGIVDINLRLDPGLVVGGARVTAHTDIADIRTGVDNTGRLRARPGGLLGSI